MAIRSFEDFAPPRRFDAIAFDRGRIEESADETGPWTEVETIVLSPIDTDPSRPRLRDLTTSLATVDPGWYRFVWIDTNDSTFTGDPVFFSSDENDDAVDDLRDTRVLIPRLRRALEGPHGATVTPSEFSDDEVNAIAADAIADLILYSGGNNIFGHQLEVVERDDFYSAPTAWRTDAELTDAEGSVIVAQAALTHFALALKTMGKTKETISDEGQTWSWEMASNVLTEQIKGLRADRDRALEILEGKHVVADSYINYLAVRDRYTDALIEPFANRGVGGIECDPRFGAW